MSLITVTDPITGGTRQEESNDEEMVTGVNAAGEWLGLVVAGTEFARIPGPGPSGNFVWSFESSRWVPRSSVVPVVPSSVTMRQARRALLDAGLLSTTNYAIASMPGAAGDAARIDWEYSQVVQRDWPLVAALMPVLGLTSEQIDQLFITAESL